MKTTNQMAHAMQHLMNTFFARAGAVALLLMVTILPAQAAYPERQIVIIVPTPAGGPVDRVTRLYAQGLQQLLGQPVVVENRVGAAGKIGVQAGLRAPRDGYTLMAVSPSIVTVNPAVDKAVGFDPLKDFEMLGIAARNTGVVVAKGELPIATLAELVRYAKTHPGELTYASFGIGTSLHLFSEELAQTLGISLRHIPYKGESQAMNALLAGEVDLMLYVTAPVVPFVKSGRLRALAATSTQRWAELPTVPSFPETGIAELKNYTYHSWVGFLMARDVPQEAISKLRQGLITIGSKPEFRRALEAQGFEAGENNPVEMQKTMADELSRNRRLIDSGRIKME